MGVKVNVFKWLRVFGQALSITASPNFLNYCQLELENCFSWERIRQLIKNSPLTKVFTSDAPVNLSVFKHTRRNEHVKS